MSFKQLTILLPCYSLEDLSLDRPPREADQLLSAWSAMFHPVLLVEAGNVPGWSRAEDPPSEPGDSLIVLPDCCETMLPSQWLREAEAAGASILRGFDNREELVSAALKRVEPPESGMPEVDPNLAADFLALGFCHLQVELLTRQLRYMSNLDEVQFERETLAAAEEAVKGDVEAARDRLRSAFDLLTEAREYFYPVETYLLDLTLVAPTTLGASLRAELASGLTNLLICGQLVDRMAGEEPETLAQLKVAVERGDASIIGGEFQERELPLLSVEAALSQLKLGMQCYKRHLGRRPVVFGRRRFGLSPVLPQLLKKLGFDGALHFTLDEGRFPTNNQSKIRWTGVEGTELEALVRLPMDATQPECFLKLPEKLGDVMDLDHAATAVFAHWPDQAGPWYRDLRRMAAYSPVLGRFVSIADYFENTQYVGQSTRYSADQYRSPYLRQAVAAGDPDPISRWVCYHRRRAIADALQGLSTISDLVGGKLKSSAAEDPIDAVEDAGTNTPGLDDLDDHLRQSLEEETRRFADLLPRDETGSSKGYLIANPWNFTRRMLIDVSKLERLPAVGGVVRSAGESEGKKLAVAEVPGMGFAWIGPASEELPASKPKRKAGLWRRKRHDDEDAPMAEENVLRNDYFEIKIDPHTGGIRSMHDYVSRGNRLAQQIALRLPSSAKPQRNAFGEDDPEEDYTIMAADEIIIAATGPVVGRIECRGRLVGRDGKQVARFTQTLEAWRGSPVLQLDIKLDPQRQPEGDPWNSYYASRFAWGDATADVFGSASLMSRPIDRPQVESPYYIDVRSERKRITILTGGLPYHRRFGLRKLDTLLIVPGEKARSFRLGVGIDLTHPVPAALDFLAPPHVLAENTRPAVGESGWLFHTSAKNVLATHWEPILANDKPRGCRLRLLETEGRPCKLDLRCFRPVKSARKVDFQGENPEDLSVADDKTALDLKAHEWVEIEVAFA